MEQKSWLKENWFKVVIAFLLAVFVLAYSYDIWEKYHPYKTFKEETAEKLQKLIDQRCRSGESPFAECIK
jgi:predicted negative regulator of RcsB-dependent stress response